MSDKVIILVATMSGTAEMIADELLDRVEDSGAECKIIRMEKATVSHLQSADRVVICSSTYGTGDVPDNGQPFYNSLNQDRPDLSGLHYGVIALGDSQYPQTFAFGGKKFDELFTALGATRVGERLVIDARAGGYPEEVAGDWLEDWLELAV
jgi:MioC protein